MRLPGEQPLSATDFFGRRTTLATAIASKIFGLNTKAVSLQDVQQLGLIRLQSQVDELSKQLVRVQRSGITNAQKQVETGKIVEKIEQVVRQTLTKFGIKNVDPKSPSINQTRALVDDEKSNVLPRFPGVPPRIGN